MSRGSIKSIDRRRTADENNIVDQVSTGASFQDVSITDIISEGEIGGLVKGGTSIFVNGSPLFSEDEVAITGDLDNTVTGATNSTSVTASASITDTTIDPTAGKRFLVVHNAIETTVELSNYQPILENAYGGDRGVTYTMTASSNIFLDAYSHVAGGMVTQSFNLEKAAHGDVAAFLDITEGTIDGFIQQTGTSPSATATFKRGAYRKSQITYDDETGTGNSHKLVLDLYLDISAISGTTITLASAPPVAFSNKNFTITALVQKTNSGTGSNKIDGSSYQFRSGTFNQEPMSYINGQGSASIPLTKPTGELERGVAKEITTSGITGAQASEIDKVKFIITYPGGLYQYHSSEGGDRHTGVGYRFELGIKRGTGSFVYERLGGNTPAGSFHRTSTSADVGEDIMAHGALNKSAVSFEYMIDLAPYQPFTDFAIKITRLTNHGKGSYPDPHWWNDPKEQRLKKAKSHWDGVLTAQVSSATGIIEEKLSYPLTSMANVRFSSRAFQNIPQRIYDVRGLKILVPSNYVTREENITESTYPEQVALYKRNTSTGAIEATEQPWDGSFRSEKVYTNNPAWVFYDILINDRYGLGEWLKTSDIDKYSLYKIGRYCDELVSDGKGSKEPRFTANLYLQKATDAYKVLKDMATIFRGMLYWFNGQVTPVIDEKKYPVYNFSKANVKDGQFAYEGTGSKTRANQYIVSWNNPEANYKLEPIIVEDRQNIIDTGRLITEKAVAFGCTSEGQAIRYGRWKLWTGVNQTEVIGFETAVNAAFLLPGDIINVQDANDFDIPFSGRLNSYSESGSYTLTLDRDIDEHLRTSGYTYKVVLIIPKKAAILNQESATIGGSSYSRGDIVTQARLTHGGSQANIVVSSDATTNLNINNALDDSNEFISLTLRTSTITQERDLTGSTTVNSVAYTIPSSASDGRTTIQITAALDEDATADLTEAIWAIKQTDTSAQKLTASSPKQYKIVEIVATEDNNYKIGAVEHYNEKFDDIEGDFNTAVDDPVFPPEPNTEPPAPLAVHILRTPRFNRPGEEVTVQWEAPVYDYIKGFEVTHNLNADLEKEVFFAGRQQLNKRFLDLPDGNYDVEVRTISTYEKRSKPTIASVGIQDIFSGDRVWGGIRKGGICTTTLDINGSSVFFTKPSYTIGPNISEVSEDDLFVYATNNSSNAASKSINIAELSQGDWAGLKIAEGAWSGTPFAYIFYDFSNTSHASNDPLRLLSWKNDTSFQYPLFYWYDADKYAANTASIWTAISGTVAVEENSNKVIGTNTSFTDLNFQNIIKLSATQGARISHIESDTVLYLDRKITAAISSGTTAYVDELGIDYQKDFVIATVYYNSSTSSYTMRPLLTHMPNLADQTRGVVVTSNVPILNYDADNSLSADMTWDELSLDIQAINFSNPEIRVTGAGFTQTNVNAETTYTAATSRTVEVHTVAHDASPAVTYAGGALEFSIEVREKDYTSLTKTVVYTISKSKDAATATGTKNAAGYLYYNTQSATNPGSAGAGGNTLANDYWDGTSYVWSSGSFTGSKIGTSGATWSHIRPEPILGTGAKMYYVYYVAEQQGSESSTASGSGLTIGTTVYVATNFVGLVVFDGTDKGGEIGLGSTGSTTIDGGRITTGTINANRITLTGKNVSDLNNDSGYITSSALSGYLTTTAANNAYATIASLNSLSTTVGNKQDASTAITTTNLTTQVTNAGFVADSTVVADLTADMNNNSSTGTVIGNLRSAMTAAGIQISASTPFATASTTIGAGRLHLQAGTSGTSSNRITLSAVTNTIKIFDTNSLRVHIGDLTDVSVE